MLRVRDLRLEEICVPSALWQCKESDPSLLKIPQTDSHHAINGVECRTTRHRRLASPTPGRRPWRVHGAMYVGSCKYDIRQHVIDCTYATTTHPASCMLQRTPSPCQPATNSSLPVALHPISMTSALTSRLGLTSLASPRSTEVDRGRPRPTKVRADGQPGEVRSGPEHSPVPHLSVPRLAK